MRPTASLAATRRTALQPQHDEIVRQVSGRNASQPPVDQRLHRLMVGIDPPEAESALLARGMADRLLEPVVLRRLKDAVLGANSLGKLRIGGEGVGAEDDSGSTMPPRLSMT